MNEHFVIFSSFLRRSCTPKEGRCWIDVENCKQTKRFQEFQKLSWWIFFQKTFLLFQGYGLVFCYLTWIVKIMKWTFNSIRLTLKVGCLPAIDGLWFVLRKLLSVYFWMALSEKLCILYQNYRWWRTHKLKVVSIICINVVGFILSKFLNSLLCYPIELASKNRHMDGDGVYKY